MKCPATLVQVAQKPPPQSPSRVDMLGSGINWFLCVFWWHFVRIRGQRYRESSVIQFIDHIPFIDVIPLMWLSALSFMLIGLSKERPILGDHAKAHMFGLRSEKYPDKAKEKHIKSAWKAYEKCMKCIWKAPLFTTKDHLQGIVTLYFYWW